jgi:hypothetical protein
MDTMSLQKRSFFDERFLKKIKIIQTNKMSIQQKHTEPVVE